MNTLPTAPELQTIPRKNYLASRKTEAEWRDAIEIQIRALTDLLNAIVKDLNESRRAKTSKDK